jgi:hypothetical protein
MQTAGVGTYAYGASPDCTYLSWSEALEIKWSRSFMTLMSKLEEKPRGEGRKNLKKLQTKERKRRTNCST